MIDIDELLVGSYLTHEDKYCRVNSILSSHYVSSSDEWGAITASIYDYHPVEITEEILLHNQFVKKQFGGSARLYFSNIIMERIGDEWIFCYEDKEDALNVIIKKIKYMHEFQMLLTLCKIKLKILLPNINIL